MTIVPAALRNLTGTLTLFRSAWFTPKHGYTSARERQDLRVAIYHCGGNDMLNSASTMPMLATACLEYFLAMTEYLREILGYFTVCR